MTSDQRSAEDLADIDARLGVAPLLPSADLEDSLLDTPLRDPRADLAISVPTDFDENDIDPEIDTALLLEAARIRRRERARLEQRMARLRLYSYFMTLAACVFALMTFMYLVQGEGDGDFTFLSLGAMFGAITVFLLWAAVRVTRFGEHEHLL